MTCCPSETYTCLERAARLPKLTSTSVPASTLPVPVTVVWTTPSSAVTTSFEVRAELVGGPISRIATITTATATIAST